MINLQNYPKCLLRIALYAGLVINTPRIAPSIADSEKPIIVTREVEKNKGSIAIIRSIASE